MIYRPLITTPFKHNVTYNEIEPCQALHPYVRCFWGGDYDCLSNAGTDESSEIVIPDTCMDIIYRMDDVGNIIISDFCGLNDRVFLSSKSQKVRYKISVFAIRFYAWTAYVFSEDSFVESVNGVMNDILLYQRALEINQLSKENFISSRQMERLFCEYIGMAPKKLSNLVRYQYLWKDIVSQSNFDIASAVSKYGYTDLSHIMREFKRFHTMNIQEAREMAL